MQGHASEERLCVTPYEESPMLDKAIAPLQGSSVIGFEFKA